jgi:hypothetical protein
MKLACNIDARGKAVRLRLGMIEFALAALVAFAWAFPFESFFAWGLAVILVLAGAFSIFEGRSGWCALRALGFHTRV